MLNMMAMKHWNLWHFNLRYFGNPNASVVGIGIGHASRFTPVQFRSTDQPITYRAHGAVHYRGR